MGERKHWIWIAAGLLTILLILWGYWGEWTAAKVFPEKKEIQREVASNPTSSSKSFSTEVDTDTERGAVKKYDAARYVRSKPLKDPFHAEAIAKATQAEKEKIASDKSVAASQVPSASTHKSEKKQKERKDDYPKLQGIMEFGSQKRAIIEWNGESYIVGEGEQVGLWTVSGIEKRTVTLTGAPGTLTISTR